EPGGIVHSRRLTYGRFEYGNPILAVSGPSPIATRRRRQSSPQAVNKPQGELWVVGDQCGRAVVVVEVRLGGVVDGGNFPQQPPMDALLDRRGELRAA